MLRRNWMQFAGASLGASGCTWLPELARAAQEASEKHGRHCILLWMAGGPSQVDTFDMKPEHVNGGPLKPASTSVGGMSFSEHLPKLAAQANRLAILRGMSTKEGDHQRGTTLMRTGHVPGGPVAYPSVGSLLSKSLGEEASELPNYVSISPGAFGRSSIHPGFLGPKYMATTVEGRATSPDDFAQLRVEFMERAQGIDQERQSDRIDLWNAMQAEFLRERKSDNVLAHDTVYRSAHRMLASEARVAFDLEHESPRTRERYGKGTFGQGCLMARRLIEAGVPLVEVTLGQNLAWDTHTDNFDRVKELSARLDSAWSSLMEDLQQRGMLEKTTILWAGEFGRTPRINNNGGRDHFPQAFSCVLAGGGINGGTTHGATTKDGMEVVDGKIDQQDLIATLCQALQVDPGDENVAEGGRPIAISEGTPITEVLA